MKTSWDLALELRHLPHGAELGIVPECTLEVAKIGDARKCINSC